jgi:F-type H+-transporting ATPase subunit delta
VKKSLSLAGKYAKALFSSLSPEKYERASGEIRKLEMATSSSELQKFLFDPTLQARAKKTLLLNFVENPLEEVVQLVSLLVEMKRIGLLEYITIIFDELKLEKNNEIYAEVETALPLSKAEEEAIVRKIEKETGLRGVLSVRDNPLLIAGYVIKFRDIVIDASLSGRLKRVSQKLGNSDSREVI